jgi:hypothetical protein
MTAARKFSAVTVVVGISRDSDMMAIIWVRRGR